MAAKPASKIVCRPLTLARWDDFVKLFGPRGACAGCWCMWPRQTSADFARLRGDRNRRLMRRLVAKGEPVGLIAYVDGEPAGWCAIAPREKYGRLVRSRVLKALDGPAGAGAPGAWAAPCFFIARRHRGRGLTKRLLEAAVEFAAERGATLVEGYPIEPRKDRMPDVWLWHGHASIFRSAGFHEVARRSPTRPIMRRELKTARRRGGAGASAAGRDASARRRPRSARG